MSARLQVPLWVVVVIASVLWALAPLNQHSADALFLCCNPASYHHGVITACNAGCSNDCVTRFGLIPGGCKVSSWPWHSFTDVTIPAIHTERHWFCDGLGSGCPCPPPSGYQPYRETYISVQVNGCNGDPC